MNLTVDRINNFNNNRINFRGPLDGAVTGVLRLCDTSEMVNAVGLDIGAMVLPRTYYDTKARNKYAGAETFFREISGTFINCLSAGLFAQLISKIATKSIQPETKTNFKSWYSYDSLDTLSKTWEKTGNTKDYVKKILDNLSGIDGYNRNLYKNIDWKNIEWVDEKSFDKINWTDEEFEGIHNKLKTKESIENTLIRIIEDKNIDCKDRKNILSILEKRITNALGANRNVEIKIGENKFNSNLENILRDTTDMGKDIFNNKNIDAQKAIKKITKINKIKAGGAIAASCILGLTNQFLNRKITEKRTGKKGFVGDVNFMSNDRQEEKKDKFLLLKKIGASALMAGMVFSVMRVKSFKEFAKKLEFTGPITSGNAIKTVYAANIIGRFMAADNGTELRESMTRDYLGFLNWLVFGGFMAKGVANLMDKKGENLFNYTKKGKGLKHWLDDMTLKTHNEIAAKGSEFAKKNIKKLNIAHTCGIAYSAITLGILLPMLNAKVTKHKAKKETN